MAGTQIIQQQQGVHTNVSKEPQCGITQLLFDLQLFELHLVELLISCNKNIIVTTKYSSFVIMDISIYT